jgi:hypothetical protein
MDYLAGVFSKCLGIAIILFIFFPRKWERSEKRRKEYFSILLFLNVVYSEEMLLL